MSHLEFQKNIWVEEWLVYNKKHEHLGWLTREKKWKCWAFSAIDSEIIFSADCLKEIERKLIELDIKEATKP
jgi:hypothetical protein